MGSKMIYLTKDNETRLSEENNMSKLINDLLNEHYNSTTPKEILLQEEEEKLEKDIEKINKLKQDVERMMETKTISLEKQDREWELEKERNRVKHELRKKYEALTKREEQSNEGFELFLKTNGYEI